MELFDAIHTRRSIRKFAPGEVTQEQLRRLLGAAMTAPSAGNAQPWQFIVITDRALLDAVPTFSQYAAMARQAPMGILVCGDLSLEKYPGYWIQDCSAATQNLLLAARGLGLGTVWTGVHPIEERVAGFRKLLNLPDRIMPLSFIVLGHPAQEHRPEDRYKAERVHLNAWPAKDDTR
ncbi:nitroreductase family protein [Desulfocurvibacter africanus]|uniref:Nitroreductase n=1 Tax=Desulfocurvibacter africanus subsp. africanus str. Walvis Bay TaxID=690850 RepID=F3YYU7_DESAF|nr:nitroreductase family protein [Desulfocurvibacter africanus]EGJ51923.1 nitroreductase [Desulfocurvibacter africanus subsp. africanus str. Walvis Bay]